MTRGGGGGARKKKAPASYLPARKSRRLRGDQPNYAEMADGGGGDEDLLTLADDPRAHLLSCDEWAEKNGITPGPAMDGEFTGWQEGGGKGGRD